MIGFYIPYIYNSLTLIALDKINDESESSFIARWSLYTICIVCQIYFILVEIPQIYYDEIFDYFMLYFNWVDITLPLFFLLHLILRIKYVKITDFGNLKVFDIFIEIAIYIESFMKTLQYLRVKEEFSYFAQMFLAVL